MATLAEKKDLMEAESKLHSKMWDDLTLRSFRMSNEEEENIWIVDAVVDQ